MVSENYNKTAIGKRINLIRLEKGMTLEEFGNLFGADKSNVLKWEKGYSIPSAERLKIISKIGNMTVSELLNGNDSEKYNDYFNKKIKNEEKNNPDVFREIKEHEDNLRMIFKIFTQKYEYTEDNALILYNKAVEYILAIALDYPISLFLSSILSTASTIQSTWNLFNPNQRKELSLILTDLEKVINNYCEEDKHIHFAFKDDYSEFKVI